MLPIRGADLVVDFRYFLEGCSFLQQLYHEADAEEVEWVSADLVVGLWFG